MLDTILIQRASNQFKYLGAEVSYYIPKLIEINSRYNYDLNFEQTSRFEIGTRYTQVEDFGVSLYYNYREPRIRYNSIFSVFNFSNTEEIEGGLDYKFSDVVTAFGKFANVTYQDEDSQRLTLGVNTTYGTVSYRTSLVMLANLIHSRFIRHVLSMTDLLLLRSDLRFQVIDYRKMTQKIICSHY